MNHPDILPADRILPRTERSSGSGLDWRCQKCRKLLGRCHDGRVLIQFARGHRYVGTVPMTAVCRCCGTLNEITR